MAKDYPPKNYDNIGDPTRTESDVSGILSTGRGSTFKQEKEGFKEMLERRNLNVRNSKSNEPDQEKNVEKSIDKETDKDK